MKTHKNGTMEEPFVYTTAQDELLAQKSDEDRLFAALLDTTTDWLMGGHDKTPYVELLAYARAVLYACYDVSKVYGFSPRDWLDIFVKELYCRANSKWGREVGE